MDYRKRHIEKELRAISHRQKVWNMIADMIGITAIFAMLVAGFFILHGLGL